MPATRRATSRPKNLQLAARQKVHAVLNSSSYWPSAGTATDGAGYDYTEVSTDADSPKIGLAGRPCYNGWIDVKATHDSAPLLWGLIPFTLVRRRSRESNSRRPPRWLECFPSACPTTTRRTSPRSSSTGCRELADKRGCPSG